MIYRYYGLKTKEQITQFSELLLTGAIFFPAAVDFNDPNEFRFQLRVPKDKAIIQETWERDNPGRPLTDFEHWYNTTSFSSLHIYLEPILQQDYINSIGVACFSMSGKSPTMWAHYANNHTGVCLGFDDLSKVSFPGIITSGNVVYQKELPVVSYFGQSQEDIIRTILFYKSTDWQYENEFRLIARAKAKLSMNPLLIREVILGMDIPKTIEDQVRDIVKQRPSPIPILSAHLSYLSYEMEIS